MHDRITHEQEGSVYPERVLARLDFHFETEFHADMVDKVTILRDEPHTIPRALAELMFNYHDESVYFGRPRKE